MRRTAAPAIGSTAVACCAALTEKAATEKPANACCGPSYIDAARDLYRDAALAPAANLCCTTNPIWQLPEMNVPDKMLAMNYGCGTTVHPRDLGGSPSIVYVGVGGGLELLQFAYFSRRRGGVIGLDVVDEMLSACSKNLDLAEEINPWFQRSFVDLRKGDAFDLPLEDGVIDVAAQNCLFNIFQGDDLGRALSEMHRVLKPKGRLILSDPICDTEIPEALRRDERLRAMCLTGAISLPAYIERLANVGFGIVEVRARRPYRGNGARTIRDQRADRARKRRDLRDQVAGCS
jgi:SAM-dependent methyltransferase